MDHPVTHGLPPASGHETRDANVKLILLSTVGVAIMVLSVCFITVGIFDYLNTHQEGSPQNTALVRPRELPPGPRVQEHPWEEYKALHADETRVLNSYGWTDQKTETVRIPIDRAIALVAERGLPLVGDVPAAPAKKIAQPGAATTAAALLAPEKSLGGQ